MNFYDLQFPSITKVLIYKQLNIPRMKEFSFKNYICFDTFIILPNKKRLWEKWNVYIPTWETKHHVICYNNNKFKTLVNNK